MKTKTILLTLFLCIGIWGCNDKEKNNEIPNGIVREIKIDNSRVLDSIISKENKLFKLHYSDKDTIFIINSKEDFRKISNTNIDFDFSKNTIVAGVIITPSFNSRTEKVVLLKNKDYFLLMVSVLIPRKVPDIYKEYLFFWRAYPKINAPIDFMVKRKKTDNYYTVNRRI